VSAPHPQTSLSHPAPAVAPEPIIRVRDLVVGFGSKIVMKGLNLDIRRGEILGFVGPSGQGKSVLTRTILGLVPKRAGTIEVFGEDVDGLTVTRRRQIEQRWGVLFQQGALFSALTVKQNIQMPMREHLNLSDRLLDEFARLKIEMVGLKPDAADKLPSELSGGMIKRAALARSLALDPEILFLDEPTSGLDPIGAGEFDELVATLKQTLGLTVFMVTHDLDSLYTACDRIAALGDGQIIAQGTIAEMLASDHPWLRAYFHGKRGRAAGLTPAAHGVPPRTARAPPRQGIADPMETRANYALIGAFTLAVLVAAFGFVFWLQGGSRSQVRQAVRIVFSGSVGGLAKGSTVAFNGIKVGEVMDVRLLPQDPRRVVAIVEVERTTPLRADTRARLDSAMLTGVSTISLSGGNADAPALTPGSGDQMPTIFADSSDIQDMMAAAKQIAQRADDVLQRLDKVVAGNEGAITRTLANVETFSKTLAEAGPAVSGLVKAIDGQKLNRVIDNTERFSSALAAGSPDIEGALKDARSLAAKLNASADRVDAVLKGAEGFLGSASGSAGTSTFTEVREAAISVRDAGRAFRTLSENLDKRTSNIATSFNRLSGTGRREVEALSTDGQRTLNTLNRTVKSLERDPSQVIFGGKPSLPEYNGGR
jgi:phospholipid/cholesterol/gamma-HCH transport system substrate-binding protein